ncbi:MULTISPECIES: hypothetical protein [Terrabacteria group]|uniref:hypothetical protein n=1 Tax=Bacillati TaxID=1783272 RepID=UPI001C6EF8D0|nr:MULTISPECIES: hypothetical protein [Terrabacteria group]MBW9213090.1 hypothetical protein [Trueperella sp. zg.1013]
MKKINRSSTKITLKRFTSDGGKEFTCHKEIEDIGIDFYFTESYSARQRGNNENVMELNNRPRKCLNYQTPFDVFIHELSLL